jgi:hypothetical protein
MNDLCAFEDYKFPFNRVNKVLKNTQLAQILQRGSSTLRSIVDLISDSQTWLYLRITWAAFKYYRCLSI